MAWNFSRKRLAYWAMSLFVAWHTFIMVLTPNSSATAQWLREWVQPYISFFRLESTWAFFAPAVGKHSQFRYVIEDKDGKKYYFIPAIDLNWFVPTHIWFSNWYYGIIENPELLGDSFASAMCQKHAALKPVSVTLLAVQELDFWREDHFAGKKPMDPQYLSVDTLLNVPCFDPA